MRILSVAVATATSLTIVSSGGSAHMAGTDTVQIIHPWAEPSSSDRTKVFPTIANEGDHAIVLIAVTTPVAEEVSIIRDGAVVDGLEIEPGHVADQDSMHLEFVGLGAPLEEGRHFPATFHFAEGDPLEIEIVIGQMTMMPDGTKH